MTNTETPVRATDLLDALRDLAESSHRADCVSSDVARAYRALAAAGWAQFVPFTAPGSGRWYISDAGFDVLERVELAAREAAVQALAAAL